MAQPDYDVIVLGGGSAGTSAATAAATAGARTAMINDGELGGLCILRGCMPTKALLESAHAVHGAKQLEAFGAELHGSVEVDFRRVMQRKDRLVERFKVAKIRSIEAADYEVIDGRARFAPGGGVDVGGRVLTARGYVIATGSRPSIPAIPGIDDVPVLTSDGVMRLRSQPRTLLVHGAGAIGLELAQFFARIGTRVTLVARGPLLHRHDAESGEELRRALGEQERLELVVPGRILSLKPDGDGVLARIGADRESELRVDAVLMATGRRAALDDLGLEHVGLDKAAGLLETDRAMRTSNPSIWGAGDATGSHQILHLSNQEGVVAGHNAAGGAPPREMDYRLLMSVIFTDPPFAQVGLREMDCRDGERNIVVKRARLPETGRAITMETRHGLFKLLVDSESREILGATILGPRADDLIHTVAALMHYRATTDQISDLPWYHPTLSEVLLSLARD